MGRIWTPGGPQFVSRKHKYFDQILAPGISVAPPRRGDRDSSLSPALQLASPPPEGLPGVFPTPGDLSSTLSHLQLCPSVLEFEPRRDSPIARNRSQPLLEVSCTTMETRGMDSTGREFTNAEEMWREQIGEEDGHKKRQWYSNGVGYWEGVEASIDGVLGGYGHVNGADIKGSEGFLKTLLSDRLGPDFATHQRLVALDCGSGIGRVSKNLLLRYFNEVDLVEPVTHFIEAARESLPDDSVLDNHKAVNFYCQPLQEFTPEAGRYDVIWVQWCIGQLVDDDFVSFFKRAKVGLKPNGLFILKENIAKAGFVLDKEDHSITRSDLYFKELFNQCGLHLYKSKDQKGLPNELFAVKMYALTTNIPKRAHAAKTRSQTFKPAIIT
ncbi:hypothetical protein Sjap_003807 [Stephania japonica]|uniref:Alpha N-terminal protein methyltransferase 1 n=1 Tax=Stephania japonica TaxID=461633 RepID=A0AAP0KPH7_9MAGN